jgi:hypothetical protein
MKKSTCILSIIFFGVLVFSGCKPKVDINKEEQAVIAVIEEERNAYFDRDLSRLEVIWVQDSTSKRIFRSETALIILNGWDEINANYREDIETDIWKDYEDLKADFSNYEINVYNNSALAYHDIFWTGKYQGEEVGAEQKRALHLVKIGGTWKIDFIAQLTIPAQ